MMKKEDKKSKDAQRSSISQELQQHELEAQERDRVHSILHIPESSDWKQAHCCGGLTYIGLGVITIILSVIQIVITGVAAATERFYDAPHTGRLVAMIIVAVVAIVTIGMVIYAIVGVRKKHSKPLHTTAFVLLILVIIQALVAGLSIHITELDELNISRALTESFYRAKDGDPQQLQLWDATQSGVECCGLYSPEDYRDPYGPLNFPPDIPASCCPTFSNPNTTRVKEREMCKANSSYFKIGCKLPVLDFVKGASVSVIVITVILIVAEVVLAILGAILSKKRKEEKHEHIEFTPTSPNPADSVQIAVPATK